MLSVPIRQILAVPDTYQAVPVKKRTRVRRRPSPSPAILQRLNDLQAQGIPAKLKWSSLGKEWYIAYTCKETPPEWETTEDACAVWRRAVGLC